MSDGHHEVVIKTKSEESAQKVVEQLTKSGIREDAIQTRETDQ